MGESRWYLYFGLYRDNSAWVWTDGTPLDYLAWNSDQPSGPGKASISEYPTIGGWGRHVGDSHTHGTVCKMLPK